MGEVVPGVTRFAVVLVDGPPLPFAEVRSPFLPGHLLVPGFVEPGLFCGHVTCLLVRRVSRACPCNALGPAPASSLPTGRTVLGGPRRFRPTAQASNSRPDRG